MPTKRGWILDTTKGPPLNTVEGQQWLLEECQRAIASGAASGAADVFAAKTLMASVKIRKDIDALKMAEDMRAKMAQLEEKINDIAGKGRD